MSFPSNVTVWNSPLKSWLKNVSVFPESVGRTDRREGQRQALGLLILVLVNSLVDFRYSAQS